MKFSNQLAVVLLNTQREYLAGHTHKCLDSFFKTPASIDKKIDLLIYFNKGDVSEYNDLLEYKNCANVNDVKIHSHELPDLDDLYVRTPKELKEMNLPKVPALGGSAGPNNLFFESMIPIAESEYEYLLMLETDSQPIQRFWIDKLINYCNENDFLIAGSIYKGCAEVPEYEPWTGHLNGIAIYRTCNLLTFFFDQTRELIKRRVLTHKNHFVNFDVAMHSFRGTITGRKFFDDRDFPEYNLVDTQIISNFSLPIDADTSIESVKKQYPQTIILHKKWN